MKSKKIKRKRTGTTGKRRTKKSRFRIKREPVLIALCSIFLLVLFCFAQKKLSERNMYIPTDSSVIPVIDVAKWEGKIDWKKVKKSGIHHAVLKIGSGDHDGTGFHEDDLFETNYKNAVRKGIECGVYFFSYAVTKEEAKKEAQYCLSLLKKYNIEPSDLFFPVAFDIEYDKALQTGKRNCTDMTVAFCETIKEAGYEPMVYSSAAYFTSRLYYQEIKDYKLWVANYDAGGPAFGKPYSMWQYSEDGVVDGVKDLCDMNYWYTDYIPVQQIHVDEFRVTMKTGETKLLNASTIPRNATNQRLDYTSSNERVVRITDHLTGEVEAVGSGTAWITVKSPTGVKERMKIKVE